MKSRLLGVMFLGLGFGLIERDDAGSVAVNEVDPSKIRNDFGSVDDPLKSFPTLYHDASHPYLQELALLGMLQIQYARGDSDTGSYGSSDLPEQGRWGGIEVRRFRLGMKALMFDRVKILSLVNLNPDFSPTVYRDLPEAYLTYTFDEGLNFNVGKSEVKFTHEMAPSSRDMIPFERSQLVNQFYAGELTGTWLSGKGIAGGWLYHLGFYSNEITEEFTNFEGGGLVLAKIGYDYTKIAGLDHAQVEMYYQYNSEPGFVGSKGDSPLYSNGFSIANEITEGKFGLDTEFYWSEGFKSRANAGGFSMMPTYRLTEKLQLVTTFQFAASDGNEGISLPLRYERLIDGGVKINGDVYYAGYLGLNYYIDENRFKILSGMKYSSMTGGDNDFNGWTWLAGVRMYF